MKLWRIIPFVLAVLFVLAGPVHAQDVTTHFCGDLSEADCQFLQDSDAAMQALESSTFALEADVRVENVPNMPFDGLDFHLSGNGSYAADVASFADLQPEDFLAEPAELFPLVADMLREVAANLTFTLEIPEELNTLLHEDEPRLPESVSLDFRMVDGVLYVNMTDVLEAAPAATVPPGWVGLDVAELYESVLPGMMDEPIANPSFDVVPFVTALMEPENLAKFATIERLEDAEVDGHAVAVFETRINYVAMLNIPEFREMLASAVGEEVDLDEVTATIQTMYEGLTLVVTKSIGLEDQLVYNTEINMDWDLRVMAETASLDAAPHFTLNFVITQQDFNNAPEVVAPDEAMLLPLDNLMGSPQRSQ
jgi:hypothetical protein